MTTAPLSPSTSTIRVLNAALAELGVSPVGSLSENSLAARTGNAIFADILEGALTGYPWRFARDKLPLTALAETAPPPWAAVYAFPAAALAVHSVSEGDQTTVFDVFGRKIVTMSAAGGGATVWAEVTVHIDPDQWSPHFRRAFILDLAAALAMPITQDERMAQIKRAEARDAFAYAKSRDAQGRSPSRIDTKLFIRARRSGGRL